MGPKFTHLVFTRINCEYPTDAHYPSDMKKRLGNKRFDPKWLEERYRYLRENTEAGIINQTNNNFQWFLLLHKRTPIEFKRMFSDVTLIRCTAGTPRNYVPDHIKNEVLTPWVITTTLDSDDAISIDFVDRVQKNFRSRKEYINLPHGYKYLTRTPGKVYGVHAPRNPFISLVEETDNALGVYCQVHGAAHLHAPVVQDGFRRSCWIQAIHGDNLLNKGGLKKKDTGVNVSEIAHTFAYPPGIR